ncbi:MAG: hypothetical protein J5527_09845 [Treponema sp.]|nr:hypothetical protein [Treponema sp.]
MKLSDKERKQIEELYMKNRSISYITEQTLLHYKVIKNCIAENQLKEKRYNDNKKQLTEMVARKCTRKEMAEILKIKEKSVNQVLKRYGIKADFRNLARKKTEEMVKKAYMQKPVSINEMSKQLKLSYKSVKTVYEKYNLENLKYSRYYNLKKLDINDYKNIVKELKETTMSLAKIAEKYGITRQRVHQIQKRFNIKRKIQVQHY